MAKPTKPSTTMELESKKVHEILKKKGLLFLHHANTTKTSKSFLSMKALLSRKYVEDNNLTQSPQMSDDIDKKYEIWDYIFLDAIHVSRYFKKYNLYGPVLFSFSIDILKNNLIPTVRVAKKNPVYWHDDEDETSRYYQSIEEFNDNFYVGNKLRDGGNHIIITCLKGKLPFNYGLKSIHIDNPGINVNDLTDGKRKSYAQAIFDYYKKDIGELGIDNLDLKIINNQLVKFQYFYLNKFKNKDFVRLFHK